ncbi:glycosyltransferase family 9 protein [Luteimicrobium sp. NPDC057192]|uniref:glycosyltransferase family 9 protein n=1 Tax=Luteimicrobium sp. NPDC057192 TaxID=3346042 RepID=UPI00362E525B
MSAPTLVVRLDSDGDVLLAGPAVRTVARRGPVDLLVSGDGLQAARLLPGVRDVLRFDAPWAGVRPPAVDPVAVDALVTELAGRRYAVGIVLTSFHQSPLPTALLLRLAGVGRVVATSEDYPGSLLDVRHPRPAGAHEVEAMLSVVEAAGFPADDDTRLAVARPLPSAGDLAPAGPYVVVHPSAAVPARAPSPGTAGRVVAELARRGRAVVVTGGPGDVALTRAVCATAGGGAGVVDRGGRTGYAELASLLAGAGCVVVGNTGPAHLATAVGTPVVSLFAPVVPWERWRPWGVPCERLGDPHAACRGTRARTCPLAGHPCLDVEPGAVADAVDRLAGPPPAAAAIPSTLPAVTA